jgi:hypothetical protein
LQDWRGWFSYGAQIISPYIERFDPIEGQFGYSVSSHLEKPYPLTSKTPSGSPTGFVLAVTAGFTPLAIGTETSGSIASPDSQAGFFALRPTVGAVDMDGTLLLASLCGSAVLHVIVPGWRFEYKASWKDSKVGSADPDVWLDPAGLVPHDREIFEQTVRRWRHSGPQTQGLSTRSHVGSCIPLLS